jgi:hypothetical protein
MNKLKIANLKYVKGNKSNKTDQKSTSKTQGAKLHSDVDHFPCKVG